MNPFVASARGWIGTPYEHQASCRGAGADCLGLIRGVWRECIGPEPTAVPAYTPDWGEMNSVEVLWNAAAAHFLPVALPDRAPGDVLLFRMRDGAVCKHVGIYALSPHGHGALIHAYSGRGVVETPLTQAWLRRLAAAFRFPRGF